MKKAARRAEGLHESLMLLNLGGKFFTKDPADDNECVSLTDKGKRLAQKAVKLCLDSGIAPNCSVSGEDGSCSCEIISLNKKGLKNIATILNQLM